MTEAIARCHHLPRSPTPPGTPTSTALPSSEGDYLALCDGKLFGTDRSLDVLLDKLAHVAADKNAEFVTVYSGQGVTEDDAARAAKAVCRRSAPTPRSPPFPAASRCTTTSSPSNNIQGSTRPGAPFFSPCTPSAFPPRAHPRKPSP